LWGLGSPWRVPSPTAQSMYALMGPWGLRRQLNNLELFVCYLAAAVHDVGHPGTFLI
jgi:hypothetical protein